MEDIHRKFVRLGRQRNKITYELLALIPEIFKNKIYEQHGYCSIYEYAAKLAGLSFPVVKKALRLGEHLEDKPHLQAAIQTQGIHKVAIIARLATPDTDGAWADNVCNMSKAGLQELSKEIRGRSGEPKKLVIELDAEMEFMFLKIKKKMGDSASNKEIFRQLLRNATRQNAPKKTYVKKSPGISKVDVPRYVPVAKKREALSATRGRCAFPGCNKPAYCLHHRERFAFNKSHDSIIPLCKQHHEFAHNGLIKNELDRPEKWRLSLSGKPDLFFRKYRKMALARPG